ARPDAPVAEDAGAVVDGNAIIAIVGAFAEIARRVDRLDDAVPLAQQLQLAVVRLLVPLARAGVLGQQQLDQGLAAFLHPRAAGVDLHLVRAGPRTRRRQQPL